MDCCQCRGVERLFGRKAARSDLKRYRKKGPDRTTRMLIDAVAAEGVAHATVLDIGGGVGAIQHELLKAGAEAAISVDASTAYVSAAREEAERQGHADRVTSHHGDFVALAPTIPEAEVVTLDRVICCYHDMRQLVGLSAERARRVYGVVYPRDTWWMKAGWTLLNLAMAVVRHPYRAFIHPSQAVDGLVRARGLSPRYSGKTAMWQVVVYGR